MAGTNALVQSPFSPYSFRMDLPNQSHAAAAAQTIDKVSAWTGGDTVLRCATSIPELEIFLVGGVVRSVLGRSPVSKDFDFVVSGAGSDSLLAVLARHGKIIDGPFGSPRWLPSEGGPSADFMIIEKFYNGLSACRSVEDVLCQFDMTANAVAVDLRRVRLLDPVGGIADGSARLIRAVRTDYPDALVPNATTLTWMGMLWIRLVHYAGALGWEIAAETASWISKNTRFSDQLAEFRARLFEPNVSIMNILSKECE